MELLGNLDKIVAETWPDGIVKIVRRETRGGLVRARVSGARAASGEILIIMDAHMEVNVGWYDLFSAFPYSLLFLTAFFYPCECQVTESMLLVHLLYRYNIDVFLNFSVISLCPFEAHNTVN